MVEQEAVHLLFVVGRQPGARLGDGLLQTPLVATNAEDGLLYGQRLEKLRRHNALWTVRRGAVGEQQQHGALVEHIGHGRGRHHAGVVHERRAGVARSLLFDDASRGRVGEPADAERLGRDLTLGRKSGDGPQQQLGVTHGRAQQSAGVRDAELRRADGPRGEEFGVVAIIDEVHVRVALAEHLHMPRRDGRHGLRLLQRAIADSEAARAEESGDDPLHAEESGQRVRQVFVARILLDDVAQVDDERQAVTARDASGGI